MSELIPKVGAAAIPSRNRVVAAPSRRVSRAVRMINGRTNVELHQLDAEIELGTQRARTVARVGTRAMEAQSVVSMTERMIVEMEPGAVHGVSHLSQKLTIGLGRVIDKTIDEVTR